MVKLDDFIPGTKMTYQERIELAVADKRCDFTIGKEVNDINGGVSFATERSKTNQEKLKL